MADVSEISKLSAEDLERIKAVIALFHLLGLTDEDISRLPQVLKVWPKLVENFNKMAKDMQKIVTQLANSDKSNKQPEGVDTLRQMVGFDSNVERVVFGEGGKPNGQN